VNTPEVWHSSRCWCSQADRASHPPVGTLYLTRAAATRDALPALPQAYPKGMPITGLDAAGAMEGVTVYHAGTELDGSTVKVSVRVNTCCELSDVVRTFTLRTVGCGADVHAANCRMWYRCSRCEQSDVLQTFTLR
jgi:hypothetical protein